MREQGGSIRELKASSIIKRALAQEQNGEILVSDRLRVVLISGKLYIYI